jgi:hypothetical protein
MTNQEATPNQLIKFKHTILLFKVNNQTEKSSDWIDLNLTQILTSRQSTFKISLTSIFKIDNNIFSNWLSCINNQTPLAWLNFTINAFKSNAKKIFFKILYYYFLIIYNIQCIIYIPEFSIICKWIPYLFLKSTMYYYVDNKWFSTKIYLDLKQQLN